MNDHLPLMLSDKQKLFRFAKTYIRVCREYKKKFGELPSMSKSKWLQLKSIAFLSRAKPYKYSVLQGIVYWEEAIKIK